MKFKKENGKFYVNREEFADFRTAWEQLKKIIIKSKGK